MLGGVPGAGYPFLARNVDPLPDPRLQLTGARRPGLRPGAVRQRRTADRGVGMRGHYPRN